MSLTIAFVMGPLDRVVPEVDTTFAFMLAAHRRGHRVVHVLPRDIGLDGNLCTLGGNVVSVKDSVEKPFEVVENTSLLASDCAAIFIRTDPPFDQEYLTVTWMLSFAERAGVRCINSPSGLRAANEKLYALEFADLCPKTMVTASRTRIVDFIRTVEGEAVVKPVDGHGGFGVVRLHAGDTNINAIVDMLTLEGKQATIAQEYVPEAAQGDKRLFVIDGELRGAVMRVPGEDDHRSNIHVGGHAEACPITDRDRQIVAVLSKRLKEDGLYFVGLDILGGMLSEVNVTSPTLVRELAELGGPDLAGEVITSVEATAPR
ncbi:MAG: glutathione synthase [Myxococcota bacterium]